MSAQSDTFSYPRPRRDLSIVDEFDGIRVTDPYRWLENPDSSETMEFVQQLNNITTPFLFNCPVREKMREKLTELWDYERYGCTSIHGDLFYYFYNSGLQNQSVLYQQKNLDEKGTTFMDPNTFSDDGTVSLHSTSFSKDGSIFAYSITERGSDLSTIKFRTKDGVDLVDVIPGVKFSGLSWMIDNSGVFYSKYPPNQSGLRNNEPENDENHSSDKISNSPRKSTPSTEKHSFHSLYFHKIGTKASQDILIADFPNEPDIQVGASVTQDGRFLVVSCSRGCEPNNRKYIVDLDSIGQKINGRLTLTPLFDKDDGSYSLIDISEDGSGALILTNYKAPMFKLVRIKLNSEDASKSIANQNESWETVIAEDPKRLFEWATPVANDKLIVGYIEDVKDIVYVHCLKTGRQLYKLPLGIGSVGSSFIRKKRSVMFLTFQPHLSPWVVYRADFSNCKTIDDPVVLEEHRKTEIKGVDPNKFTVDQVFIPSLDGTKIPMYILHAKNLSLDSGGYPTILTGYGGFNVGQMPDFSIVSLFFLNYFGGVLALSNLRGGNEYGENWHEAGMRERKQNVFDDFFACAEYLIKNGYTMPKKLAITGGSNGGLLMGACSQQRPELFGSVINKVGVLDMLRFHKFTIGAAWVPEYGNPDVPEDFKFIYKYSPLHNIRSAIEKLASSKLENQQWPATLLMTADHDDRVVPSHTLKYVAELYDSIETISEQNNGWRQRAPILARIDVKSGHGHGKPTAKMIEEQVDIYCFLERTLEGMDWIDD